MLAEDPILTKELEAAAKGEGLGWRTVERAKKDLGLVAKRRGSDWYWLPKGRTEL